MKEKRYNSIMRSNDIILALMKINKENVSIDKIEKGAIYFSDHTFYIIKKILDNEYVK